MGTKVCEKEARRRVENPGNNMFLSSSLSAKFFVRRTSCPLSKYTSSAIFPFGKFPGVNLLKENSELVTKEMANFVW